MALPSLPRDPALLQEAPAEGHGRTCIRKQPVWQADLECPIDSQHQFGTAQAVEPQIPVKITIEGDSDPAMHMGVQLPNQVPHEAAELCSNLGTGFLRTVSN